MKMSSVIQIIYITTIITSCIATTTTTTTCTMDDQCNTSPYGLCAGSVNDCSVTVGGIALDSVNNDIYYAAQCRCYSDYNTYNITVKKVSAQGGIPTTVFTEPSVSIGSSNIDKLFTVVNNVLYFDRIEKQPGSYLSTFNIKSGKKETVATGPGFFEGQIEISNGATYTCQFDSVSSHNYSVVRYAGEVGQTASSTGTKLYNLGSIPCGPIRRGKGSDIYFTTIKTTPVNKNTQIKGNMVTYTTTFYRGTISGSLTLPAVYFTVNDEVNDFEVDTSAGTITIVYGCPSGLFKRVGTTTTTLSTEAVTGVAIYDNIILYNNGMTIRSITLDGKTTNNIVSPTTGKCSCRSGFTGNDCQTCNNGQIQWVSGMPSCVALNKGGEPKTCMYDYQCGNAPYSVCSSSVCGCRENFTGEHCDQCTKTISFNNGIPVCQ